MMKFFRKHKKAVSPVIAVMLLVAVAVAAVGAYFIWFRSFQTQTQGAVQEQASGALGSELQVANIANDADNYYISLRNAGTQAVNITAIKRGTDGNNTPISTAMNVGTGTTKTLLYAHPSLNPVRGTTNTFTIEYYVGTDTTATGVVVHTYTDS